MSMFKLKIPSPRELVESALLTPLRDPKIRKLAVEVMANIGAKIENLDESGNHTEKKEWKDFLKMLHINTENFAEAAKVVDELAKELNDPNVIRNLDNNPRNKDIALTAITEIKDIRKFLKI